MYHPPPLTNRWQRAGSSIKGATEERAQRGRVALGQGVDGGGSGYGVSVHITADAQGLPAISLSKKRHSKSVGLTVSLQSDSVSVNLASMSMWIMSAGARLHGGEKKGTRVLHAV
jgi:hypothetical protein